MDILDLIEKHSKETPDRAACISGGEKMTYEELERRSDGIAAMLLSRFPGDKTPVIVYGHKNPMMIAAFIGCAKAGRAYCPLDISLPGERVREIIKMSGASAVLVVEEPDSGWESIYHPVENKHNGRPGALCSSEEGQMQSREKAPVIIKCEGLIPEELPEVYNKEALRETWLAGDDIVYIIFTSGSTGKPKGVQIPYSALCSFTDWSLGLCSAADKTGGARFLNQAPFSFDLSVMDLYTCLAAGGTLYPLTKKTQNSYALLFETLREINPDVWVSTPSFAELCLADTAFKGDCLTSLRTFMFCGERLTNITAQKLIERFPDADVINTYGPTESTVAVTDVKITPEMCLAEESLPVGRAKPGCEIFIVSDDGIVPEGSSGEIVITGETLSAGYLGDPCQTDKAFRQLDVTAGASKNGASYSTRGYFTGDEGYIRDGMLYFNGRLDSQVKLHGYRIELGDIENNLLKIPGIIRACVVPAVREGRVNSLTAAICCEGHEGSADGYQVIKGKDERIRAKEIKEQLRGLLPEYMIPKKIVFLSGMPLTQNGKADRKAVAAAVEQVR